MKFKKILLLTMISILSISILPARGPMVHKRGTGKIDQPLWKAEKRVIAGLECEVFHDGIIKLVRAPGRGYNFDALIYIPKTLRTGTLRLMIGPTNTQLGSDKETEPKVLNELRGDRGWQKSVADSLMVPTLSLVFPRYNNLNIHSFTLDALNATGKLERIDLQVSRMIEDANRVLEEVTGRDFEDKVLICGHSSSGDFASRFTMLHPEKIHACISGIEGGNPMRPTKSANGYELGFPHGIADYKEIMGYDFDYEEFKTVHYLSANGALDEDVTHSMDYPDLIAPFTNKEDYMKCFGHTIRERCEESFEAFRPYTDRFQVILWRDYAHQVSFADYVKFFSENMDDEWVPLVSTHGTTLDLHT